MHGVIGSVYYLISDAQLHVNGRFDFLASGSGPAPAVVDTQPWSHPGTYISAISVQVRRAADNTSEVDVLLVGAGGHRRGFAMVSITGRLLSSPYTWQAEGEGEGAEPALVMQYASAHVLEVQTAQFRFHLVNSDRFLNHEVMSRVPLSSLTAHSLLGQTHRDTTYPTQLKYIQGSVDEYEVEGEEASSRLLATRFAFSRFR